MADHPLDPLSADEFRQNMTILRRDAPVTESFRVASVELQEPDKAFVKAGRTVGRPRARP